MTHRRYAVVFGGLSLAFGGRVLAQAVQRWGPVSFLPPFDDFQGSGLPYPVLLGAQLLILAVAAVVLVRMRRGTDLISVRLILPVTLFAALYFLVMAVRLVLGLSVLSGSGWFSSWIPTVFHLVLATMLLLIAAYQHRVG